MKIPIHLSVCLASFAFGGLIPNTATASELLSTEDRNELKNLAASFVDALERGDERSLPDLIESISLRNLMKERQLELAKLRDIIPPAKFEQVFRSKPDFPAVLEEEDPVKFFGSMDITEYGKTRLQPDTRIKSRKLASIAGDRTEAYLVIEETRNNASDEPAYEAWPVVRGPNGWRLDVTTILLGPEKPAATGGKPLLPGDEKAIADLATILISGDWSKYSKVFNETHLKYLMKEHQSNLNKAYEDMGEHELEKYYSFSPDLKSVLREKNPVNYFNKIYPTSLLLEEREAMVKEVGARIVGIAGDRKSAYAIVEESPVADDGLGPLLSVIRAKHDGNVWHIDLDPRLIPALGSLDY